MEITLIELLTMMKRMLLSLLIGAGLIFGEVSALSAAEAADSTLLPEQTEDSAAMPVANLSADTTLLPAGAAEKRLQRLEEQMTGLTSALERVDRETHRLYAFDPEYLLVLLIVLISVGGAVTALFFILRFWYLVRKRRYELELSAMERGVWPENKQRELPLTTFVRRLLVVGIVALGILSWIGVINLGYMRFFPSALLWALIGGLGYAVVYLFRLYVRRRDAEGQ